MTKLIFGCGYLGNRVARRWREAGHDVVAVTRSRERASDFKRQGYGSIVADVTRPETLKDLPIAETVLFAVGHDRTSGKSIEEVDAGGVRNVLDVLPEGAGRFIYISTTGVYGPAEGEWVDEATTPHPQRDGGRASWAAEQALAQHPLGARSVILRLAGIYGPGRVPFINELRAGKPIPAPITGHLNLIHVEDAAAVVVAASHLAPFESGPQIYCVSDGHPVERGEFYREVARQIGAPPPRFVEPDSTSPRALRASSDRRVRNDRMRADLQITLTYPDYRVGLTALLETQNQQTAG
ncbi:MAG: SDR family oxidoreductase [Pirellulales bacterium]